MAKIYGGIFQAIIGKIGNLIGSTWKGIPVIRIRPDKYHDAKTRVQRKQRACFVACSRLAVSLKSKLIWPVWDPVAEKMSGYNLFISKNTKNFNKRGKIADYPAMVFSLGNLSLPEDISAKLLPDSDNSICLTWSDNSAKKNASPDDQLKLVTIIGNKVTYIDQLAFTRHDRQATFHPDWGSKKIIHCYPFFANQTFTKFSPNYYLSVNRKLPIN